MPSPTPLTNSGILLMSTRGGSLWDGLLPARTARADGTARGALPAVAVHDLRDPRVPGRGPRASPRLHLPAAHYARVRVRHRLGRRLRDARRRPDGGGVPLRC